MQDLHGLICGYLESSGFTIIDRSGTCIVADRPIVATERDTWIVWPVPAGTDTRNYETQLAPEIRRVLPNYPDGKGFVVGLGAAAFCRDFTAELRDRRVNYRAAVEFFDTEFKFERARSALSAIQELRSADDGARRVAQPYLLDDEPDKRHADLLPGLLSAVRRVDGPGVHIVVGRAGIGKSVLFRALFAQLYDDFIKAKGARQIGRRPIPLLPAHRKNAYGLRTELIVESFLNTEVAAPMKRELFEWLLVNGFMTWLLDGLDELYAGDADFFYYLLEHVTKAGSRAQIVVCCRDSLLTTCDAFSEFRELCSTAPGTLKVYRLDTWDRDSKRALAFVNLEGRLPRSGEGSTGRVTDFMRRLDESPSLKSLSNVGQCHS